MTGLPLASVPPGAGRDLDDVDAGLARELARVGVVELLQRRGRAPLLGVDLLQRGLAGGGPDQRGLERAQRVEHRLALGGGAGRLLAGGGIGGGRSQLGLQRRLGRGQVGRR